MVKLHTAQSNYPYPLPAVTLAYFLRYPNPYSTHVLSTDVISRHVDAATGRLHTTRLHLKQSKLPTTILKLLPSGILSGGPRGPNGEAQNFILETSVVDPQEGWMETETRNLQYTGVLSVVEKQRFSRPAPAEPTANGGSPPTTRDESSGLDLIRATQGESTECETMVTFVSRFGLRQQHHHHQNTKAQQEQEQAATDRRGFFSTWSTGALQRTIEASGMQRTRNALVKSKEGMMVVLERMREGGLVGALEGMRRDRELMMGGGQGQEKRGVASGHVVNTSNEKGSWEGVWRNGADEIASGEKD